jgi:hypothetical protein
MWRDVQEYVEFHEDLRNVGVTCGREFLKRVVGNSLDGIICFRRFVNIGAAIEEILKLCLRNFRGCIVGNKSNVYRLLVGKPEGKRPLGRPRRRWIDNIKMDLLEIGLSVVDWIGLAQDRYRWRALVNSVMNLRAP